MKFHKKAVFLSTLFVTSVSANAGQVGSTLHKKESVALTDVPQAVMSVIGQANPDFKAQEAEKELKHGNIYYDIEGIDGSGNEIEFDMLLGSDGSWSIAETQRDLSLTQCPNIVANLYNDKVGVEPARIIESDQGDGVIVYEFYTRDAGKEKKYEIKLTAQLLDKEWAH